MNNILLAALITGGLILFAVIVAVPIAVTTDKKKYWVTFDHFSTEVYVHSSEIPGVYSTQVVFDKKHWYLEPIYKNETKYSYNYANGKVVGTCQLVGNHTNCFVTNDIQVNRYEIPEEYNKTIGVKCPRIHKSKLYGTERNLTMCDLYELQTVLIEYGTKQKTSIWVETSTNHPVKEEYSFSEGDDEWEVDSYMEYVSFNSDKPANKSRTNAVPGVKVYDFRTGKGLAKSVKSSKFTNWYQRIIDSLFGAQKEQKASIFKLLSTTKVIGPERGVAPVKNRHTRDEIPEHFDAREHWPQCTIISKISDQGDCGCCWAMSSAAVLSDRVCIATNGNVNRSLSPQYMINCFTEQYGCGGGFAEPVWHDLMEIGTVPETCVRFRMTDGVCYDNCDDWSYLPKRTKAKNFYSPWGETDKARVEAIQRDIMEHGPVVANYLVFDDFQEHVSSIYTRSKKAVYTGAHAVRVIGWGTEDGIDYWLVANSWGTDWKDNGFFKIRRGNNECNIEEMILSGEPLLE